MLTLLAMKLFNAEPIEILYAEDQEADALFVEQAFLTSKTKFNLHFVKDGREAMEYLRGQGKHAGAKMPDIIFLDINMLRKTGPVTLEEIRADSGLCHIPVIMLSGSALDRDIENCYLRHASAYVQKPLTFPEMLEFVSAIEQFWVLHAILPRSGDAP